jgi:hypothetical protein
MQVVQRATTAAAKPVTQAARQVTTTAVAKPAARAVQQASTAAIAPVAQAVKRTATAVAKPVTGAGGRVQSAARAAATPAGTSTAPARGSVTPSSTLVVGGSFSSAAGVATGTADSQATSAGVPAIAALAAPGQAVGLGDPSLAPGQSASQTSATAPGSLPQAAAASPAVVGGGSSSGGGVPGGALGLGALLGLLGLAAFRSGQVASGIAAVHGTGGLRAASQSLLTFAWSGRCIPVGAEGSPNAALAGGAAGASATTADGGRGEAKGVLASALPDAARGGGSVSPGLPFIDLPKGGGGPSALLWGLLVGAAAAFGALVGKVSSGGFAARDDAS